MSNVTVLFLISQKGKW